MTDGELYDQAYGDSTPWEALGIDHDQLVDATDADIRAACSEYFSPFGWPFDEPPSNGQEEACYRYICRERDLMRQAARQAIS